MDQPTNEQVEAVLIGIISDGFNRSLNALAEAGTIDLSRLHQHYSGVGSKSYDLVTAEIELAAKVGVDGIRALFSSDPGSNSSSAVDGE